MGLLKQKQVDWKLEEIYLSFNEISDFGIDDICEICTKLRHLRFFDLDGNMFFGLNKLRNLQYRLKYQMEREHITKLSFVNL